MWAAELPILLVVVLAAAPQWRKLHAAQPRWQST
jgi:hypothetical protein